MVNYTKDYGSLVVYLYLEGLLIGLPNLERAGTASIHNDVHLARNLANKNIPLVKLPAYSYDLNPIEMAFGLAKSLCRKTPEALQQNITVGILDAFLGINLQTMRGFYWKAWKVMH